MMNPELIAVVLIISSIIVKNKLRSINFIFFAIIATYIIALLKSIYHCPRPYWVNRNIIPLEKYAEYGNPSGHASMGWIFITYFMEVIFYRH